MNERAMKEFERKKFYKLKEILLSQNDGSSNNKNNNKNMNDEEVAKDWKIETKERKSGTSQGKFDCYFIDSRTNERYRSIAEVQKMLKTRNNHVHVVDNSRHEHKHNSSQNPENDDLGEQVIENKNKKTVMDEDLMSDGKRKEKNNHDCDDDNDDHRARKILKPTIEVPVPIIRTAASKAGIAIVSDEDELDAFEEEEEEVPPQFCGSQRKSAEDARSELLRRAGINPSSSKSSFGNRRKSNVGSGMNNNNNNNNNSNNSSAVLAQRRVQTITPTTTTTTPNRFATVATDAIGKRVSHQQRAPTLATTTASRGSGSSIQKYYQQQEEQKNNTLNNYNNYEKKKNKSINNNNINSKKDWTKLNGDSSAAVKRNNGSSNDDSFMNDIDPEVAFERQKLKERFEDKEALKKKEQDELLEQQGRDNNNNNNNNNNRSALPKKYEHLASIFNGLKMCSELLRMRQSAQTVENICQCVQNVVRRDVKLEHLLKIETVKPGTFLFTKKAAFVLAASKRTTTTTTMTNNNKNNDKNEFKISQQQQQQNTIDPKSIRIDIIQSALQTTNNDKKEFENLRQADFRNRLMRICDDAYLAFCQKNGIELSMMDTTTQTTATEPTLWNDKFNIEIEAPEIAICRIRDPAFVLISNTIDKEPLSTKSQTNSSIGSPFVVVSNNGDGLGEQQQQQQPQQQQHQTALMMTPFPAVKVVTERDIDDEVRRLQRTNSTNSQLFTNNDCFGDDGNDDYDDNNMHEDGSLNASLVTMGGVSRLAIRKVLERKFEKDALHSPSAVALRAETKIKQNLPKIFDLVHSLFVTSRRSVFVFETLLDKTKEQLNLDAGAYSRDEIEDCLRTLAKTCGEWCKIERAGDNTELFRLTTAVPSSARPTAPCPAPTTNEHQNGNNNKSSHVIFEGVAKRTKHKLLENSKNTQTPSFVGVFHQHLNTQRNRFL